jgi:preprotein translocase subunit Sec63
MKNLLFYIGIILLAIYIISPVDALPPSLLDDLIAIAILIYLIKNRGIKGNQHTEDNSSVKTTIDEVITLDDAFRVLGIGPDASKEEIKRAYKERIAKNHPDKVSHLSRELQEKAEELTLRLNRAYEVIKRYRGFD